MNPLEQSSNLRSQFIEVFGGAGFRESKPLSLVQPSIKTSFLFSVGFVDVLSAIAGNATELDGAATVQRCFRHFDVERVGDDRHLSFFEMAGVLKCSDWEVDDLAAPLVKYLLEVAELPKERLHATYFSGIDATGNFLEPDERARNAYIKTGILEHQIWPGDNTTNIWFEGANSGTERSGICGPHSEIFFDMHPESTDAPGANPLTHPERFLEVSNIVTITHHADAGPSGEVVTLPQPLVELAMGVERIEVAINGQDDVHRSPKLVTIAEAIKAESGLPSVSNDNQALRIATDHLRAITNLMADGGRPGPKGQGHVVRRLYRGLIHAAESLQLDLHKSYPTLMQVIARVDGAINPNIAPQLDTLGDIFAEEVSRMQSATP